ncbi:DUF3955 domain-containing protein [Oceanirhabdus sp. W0125-5]|uniref:DUF3955 domain-containing protein n=1 Tax=Oceanirhabdus sp. W0125-5 TaxID=2999116 RepID=UPI0022F2BCB5|nr:DUF3955 domain-containing protein [Oceanirhabdus sp. W0125-5]WBW96788.1 DUF3955 domain-containing protein [Oceanirhabdus sp. W0125-5]
MKKYLISLISFILGLCCFLIYSIIGCKVAPDGTLVEPFYLIPIGYLFIAIGIIIAITVNIISRLRSLKTNG